MINTEARRLERVVGEMLSVAEIEAGSLKIFRDDVRLDALLTELQSDYAAQAADRGIQLVFNLPPKLPVISADRSKVMVIVHNLLGNALKYTGRNGQVTVGVQVEQTNLYVSVQDNGIGISDADAEKIFDKFYRAKDERVARITGSGVGLTLAKEIARLHGGDITVQSELNRGSTFTLALPMTFAAAGAEAA